MNGRKVINNMDNKGSTLVEIIVSVLIIGIVFVPLMLSLTNALKTNAKAESSSYAESVATNSLETVKTLGYETIQGKFVAGTTEVLASDFTAKTGAKLIKVDNRNFKVTGLEEGIHDYYATITFSDAYRDDDPTTTKQNEELYYQFTEISNGKTCMVKCLASEDDSRLNSLKDMSGPDSYTFEIPNLDEMKRLTNLKQTVFTIGKYGAAGDADGENKNKMYVKRDTRYKVATTEGSKNFFDDAFLGYWPADGYFSSTEICPNDAAGAGPDTFLIFYSSLKNSGNLNTLNTDGNKEEIIINKTVSGPIKIYIFITNGVVGAESGYAGSDLPAKMNITVVNSSATAGNADDVLIYCSAKTNVDYAVPSDERIIDGVNYSAKKTLNLIPYESEYDVNPSTGERHKTKQGVVDKEEGKQLYDVLVRVYDDNGTLQATKKATIIE